MFHHDARHTSQSPFVGAQTPTVRWTFALDPASGFFLTGSPVVGSDGTIYIGAGGFDGRVVGKVLAITPDGTLKWDVARGEGMEGAGPALAADDTVYVGNGRGCIGCCFRCTLQARDPSDGSLKWSISAGTDIFYPIVAPDGMVYITTDFAGVSAIDPDGTLRWTQRLAADGYGPAVADDGTIYTDSVLRALDPLDGHIRWESPVGYVRSSSVATDGTVYALSQSRLFAVNPLSGVPIWSQPVDVPDIPPPAIRSDGTIVVSGHSRPPFVQTFAPDGTRGWRFPLEVTPVPEAATGVAIGADATIYVGVRCPRFSDLPIGRRFFAINQDGTEKWSYEARCTLSDPVIGADGTVYVVLLDEDRVSRLYAFGGQRNRRVVVIDIDGLRRDNFDLAYRTGMLPNFERILGANFSRAVHFTNATTVFPSVTLTGHASIFTGVYPGAHGIVGNQWFDRFQQDFTDYMSPLLLPCVYDVFPGCEGGLANRHLEAPTLYQAASKAGKTSLVVFNQYWNGATEAVQPSAVELLLYLSGKYDDYVTYDTTMMDHAIRSLTQQGFPSVLTLYFALADAAAHRLGTSSQMAYLHNTIDPQVGRLLDTLQQQDIDWPATTLFIITSDHGRTDVLDPAEDREIDDIILDSLGGVGYDSSRTRLAKNGGMAHVYLRSRLSEEPWSVFPSAADVVFAAQTILGDRRLTRFVQAIYVRENGPGSGYRRYDPPNGDLALEVNPLGFDSNELVHKLDSPRSGDLLILLNEGHYFLKLTDPEVLWGDGSSHGALREADLAVPLILAGAGITPGDSAALVRTVNIVKTIADFLGFSMGGVEPSLPDVSFRLMLR
jgi:outer membrane protein assembly factor BamB/arylsulfatase A-like enzyme